VSINADNWHDGGWRRLADDSADASATDRLQIAHHQQQVNIAMLPSHLAILRLMGVLPKALRNCSDKAFEFVSLCEGEFGEPVWDRKANFALGICIVGYRHVADSFTHSRFTSCSSTQNPHRCAIPHDWTA